MKPPFELTSPILNLVSQISQVLGSLNSLTLTTPEPKLRKKNQIRTIKGTLAIEGNTFTEEQITGVLENKKVLGSKKEMSEVKNAIALYDALDSFNPSSVKSLLNAHSILMKGLIDSAGQFRTKNVGILKGQKIKHVAPQPKMVPELIKKLFQWFKKEKDLHLLIRSCIVHYEIEFIHPFEDGNGRMGRFWQSRILTELSPIFRYVPVESLIEKNQRQYYQALEKSDKQGSSTPFIEFMLSAILESLREFDSETKGVTVTSEDRLAKANNHFQKNSFSRKEYMELFKSISTATASRDLVKGVDLKILKKSGQMNQARYEFN